MSDKNSKDQNSQSDNDEDFGLPPVNVTPLEGAKGSESGSGAAGIKPGIESKNNPPVEKEKDNTLGVFLIILLFIIGLGFGLYYFGIFDQLNQGTSPEKEKAELSTEQVPSSAAPEEEAVIEEPVVEEEKLPVLSEINSQESAPRYFLVVASFIDDDLARDYSNRLNKKGENTFLIHPYGKIHYYRLAIGQYENVDLALEAMEEVQEDYKENLWVLKY
ncbi:SPOR domain-containing protein [Cyclobacterium qasimii]|uniref:SPOR domain-containing protein n=2 Tax=Cyclobacterium qasimii TaxID=1350429 RepID=S7WF86_9BACT|nr:SPOR domain-containing protein [Cyclobacterium qasimii]EPR65419.1 hypothetical protein ADICYQ_5628 [Cyclobacterium qasimii M12-11B]GEO20131.1 hypothetical protein CQA01_06650 [Cyclobacterium qasimii]